MNSTSIANNGCVRKKKRIQKIATHSGTFHYDEILARAVLRVIYGDLELIRSRDPKELQGADIVYDVGGVFDPNIHRYDHHQKSFTDTYSPSYSVKLSSCGLIYKYFCDELFQKYGFDSSHRLYDDVKSKIYGEFFLYADALDNGVEIFGEIKPRTIGSLVAGFNVYDCKDEKKLEEMQYTQFKRALEIVKLDLEIYLNYIFNDYVKNYMLVYDELVNHEGPIYVTNLKAPPALILAVDAQLKAGLKHVIYKNKNDFRILALPVCAGSFETRAPLLKEWRGYRDEELSRIAQIPDCIFVHATGFTGGNKTLGGALAMSKASISHSENIN